MTTVRARVEYDWIKDGVKIGLGDKHTYLAWPNRSITFRNRADLEAPDEDAWLNLPQDYARALYEELAEYFGHGPTNTRALRKDYDEERKRVDKLIDHIIKRPTY